MSTSHRDSPAPPLPATDAACDAARGAGAVSHIGTAPAAPAPPEVGGRGGLDPTRFGDWEKGGRCIDF